MALFTTRICTREGQRRVQQGTNQTLLQLQIRVVLWPKITPMVHFFSLQFLNLDLFISLIPSDDPQQTQIEISQDGIVAPYDAKFGRKEDETKNTQWVDVTDGKFENWMVFFCNFSYPFQKTSSTSDFMKLWGVIPEGIKKGEYNLQLLNCKKMKFYNFQSTIHRFLEAQSTLSFQILGLSGARTLLLTRPSC